MTLYSEIEADGVPELLINISPYTDQFLTDRFLATGGGTSPEAWLAPPSNASGTPAPRDAPPSEGPYGDPETEATVDRERQRIARDIHDVSGRYIVSMLFQLAAIEKDQSDPFLLQALAELRVALTAFSEDLQDITKSERHGVPRAAQLVTAVSQLVSDWEGQIGIAARFRHRGLNSARFDDRTAEATFRIIQEGLTNIAKHAASASLVTVALRAEADRLMLEIEDDGTGAGPAPRFDGHRLHQQCGIAGMLQRATELGGTFSIRPRQAMPGMRLVASLPLQPARSSDPEGGPS